MLFSSLRYSFQVVLAFIQVYFPFQAFRCNLKLVFISKKESNCLKTAVFLKALYLQDPLTPGKGRSYLFTIPFKGAGGTHNTLPTRQST